jgi:hypothetical protein
MRGRNVIDKTHWSAGDIYQICLERLGPSYPDPMRRRGLQRSKDKRHQAGRSATPDPVGGLSAGHAARTAAAAPGSVWLSTCRCGVRRRQHGIGESAPYARG